MNEQLVFHLRRIIPFHKSRKELLAAIRENPELTVIVERRSKKEFTPPAGFMEVAEIPFDEKTIEVYRKAERGNPSQTHEGPP